MSRPALFPICLGTALALHILPFLVLDNGGSRAAGSGSGGSGQVTLAAASQQLVQQAKQWNRPPDVPDVSPAIATPEVPSQPQFATPPARTEVPFPVSHLAPPSPPRPAAPFADASPASPASPSPPAKPVAPEKPTVTASAARQQEQATGKQQQEIKGDAGAQATTTGDLSRATTNLKNRWGAAIIARIQRQKRPPRGGGRGTVRLNISVSTKGRLIAVSLAQSSGHAAIDQAALGAVRKARLPRSPKAISPGNYSFTFRMVFTD